MTTSTPARRGPRVAAALLLLALLAPSGVLAAEPDAVTPVPAEEPPTVVPHSTEAPTDGEVVYDGPFIEPTDDVDQAPASPHAGLDAPVRPAVTPPATDAAHSERPSAPGGALPTLLAAIAGVLATGLRLGRVRH